MSMRRLTRITVVTVIMVAAFALASGPAMADSYGWQWLGTYETKAACRHHGRIAKNATPTAHLDWIGYECVRRNRPFMPNNPFWVLWGHYHSY